MRFGDILVNNLLFWAVAACIWVLYAHKRKRPAPAAERPAPDMDPDRAEKVNQACADMEAAESIISQYRALYDMYADALQNVTREAEQRKLTEKLINLEKQIHKTEQQRNKAYYIANN